MADAAQQQADLAAAITATNRAPTCRNDGNLLVNTTIVGYSNGEEIGANLSAFYNVLFSIKLNNDTIKELIRHGLHSLEDLTLFSEKDLEKFAKSVLTNKSPDATRNIWFPVKAQYSLQLLRL